VPFVSAPPEAGHTAPIAALSQAVQRQASHGERDRPLRRAA
jgi:hypothetical protein